MPISVRTCDLLLRGDALIPISCEVELRIKDGDPRDSDVPGKGEVGEKDESVEVCERRKRGG